MATVRKYSIKDLDSSIESIKKESGLTEEQIASKLGYNSGYISQTRTRGIVTDKFIERLRDFAKGNDNGKRETLARIEATIDVLFDVAVELLSATKGENVTLIRKKLEKRVDEIMKFSGD